ncbi:TPA: hypothetical protein HA235_01570 [Candidatus Woesearchaeota archaeon]|nr:nucleotidyltransferase domain-containing protein [Candidatus Woesearchaeota archaeon]HIH31373.1 hypothetical protein [Candidatus Woesearchaeota archaeon]HIH54421.1 hypothetical protein [Candidatus Woesearchaeota archaeon]HIJ02380.1 hypothetical protein [Candidatus Woesearchaeota archaeon]HIJ14142.1 hypothetical protein [Candidatus Woesearchaeota archaeon]
MDAEKIKEINSIIDKVKKFIKPDSKVIVETGKIIIKINSTLKDLNISAECVKGGSIAKDTFLKNDHDIDLFVRFALNYRGKNISDILEVSLKKSFPKTTINRIHGSRDYFQFKIKNLDYEVIPVLRIHASNYQNAENITDLSPEHVSWVEKYTKLNPELNDEIRLAKQFLKSAKVYGAESYINGFSGHIVDILIIHYGSFLSMIKKFSDINNVTIKNPIIIDHENNMKNPLKELNPSKISPLIVIDPIQKDRNAAAALNAEKLSMFSEACKKFLENPSKEFFEIKKFDLENEIKNSVKELKKSYQKLKIIIIDIEPHINSKDIMGTKILKIYEDIKNQLSMMEFNALKDAWNFDFEKESAIIYLIFENKKLSETIEQTGPPLSSWIDVESFKKKHEKTFIKGNRIFSINKRKFCIPEEMIRKLITEEFIRARAKKISIREIKIL